MNAIPIFKCDFVWEWSEKMMLTEDRHNESILWIKTMIEITNQHERNKRLSLYAFLRTRVKWNSFFFCFFFFSLFFLNEVNHQHKVGKDGRLGWRLRNILFLLLTSQFRRGKETVENWDISIETKRKKEKKKRGMIPFKQHLHLTHWSVTNGISSCCLLQSMMTGTNRR